MKIVRAHPEPAGFGGFTEAELADPNPPASLRSLRATRGLAAAQAKDMLLLPNRCAVLPYFEIGDRVRFAEPLWEGADFAEKGRTGVVVDYAAEEYLDDWHLNYEVRADDEGSADLVGGGSYRGYQLELVMRADNAAFWRRGDDLARAEHKAWLAACHPEITHKMWLLANYPEHPDNLRSENAGIESPETSIPKP